MYLHKGNKKHHTIIFISLFILFGIIFTTHNLYIVCISTTISFILILNITRINSLISGILNISILLYLPFLIDNNHQALLRREQSSILFLTLIIVFVMTIINFFTLSTHVDKRAVRPLLAHNLLIVFVIYICLIYSTISSFAILYSYLSTIFNEGIISESVITKNIDALYFSTTTFFTIGLGDIYPTTYSTLTKTLVMTEAIISHIITVILWPVAIIIIFNQFEITNQDEDE